MRHTRHTNSHTVADCHAQNTDPGTWQRGHVDMDGGMHWAEARGKEQQLSQDGLEFNLGHTHKEPRLTTGGRHCHAGPVMSLALMATKHRMPEIPTDIRRAWLPKKSVCYRCCAWPKGR